jgi:hypothetical protein
MMHSLVHLARWQVDEIRANARPGDGPDAFGLYEL